MQNFYEQVAAVAARFPDHVAIEVQSEKALGVWRYRDLQQLAERAAHWLRAQGIAAGDRAAILADNDAHWCAAYLGALRIGAVAVPLDTAYKAKQIAIVLADSGAKVIWTSPKYLDRVREAVGSSTGAPLSPCLIGMLHGDGAEVIFAAGVVDNGAPCPAGPADPAVTLYSSGTTGDPKGVVLTHANLIAERDSVFQVVHVDEHDTILGVLPLFHALAQMANLLLPFAIGAKVVFLETVNTTELLRALSERGITCFCCVPQFFYLIHQRVMQEVGKAGLVKRTMFRTLLGLNGWLRASAGVNAGPRLFSRVHRVLGPRMRLLVTGGSRFDPIIGRDLYRLGFNIRQAYGLTETSGAASITRENDSRLDSVGQPLPGTEFRILPKAALTGRDAGPTLDADTLTGRDAGPTDDDDKADGEIAIRGPIVMQGYFNRPDANAQTIVDGWLHTGDLGYLDGDGRLYITGRKKEIIVLSSGKNIYPEEIEATYLQSPFVKELCVVGLSRPGEPSSERLHALVRPDEEVLREKKIVNTRELIRFELEGLSVQLPSHKRILGFDITLDPLPRTTTGKLKRFEILRKLTRESRQEASAPVAVSDADAAWQSEAHAEAALSVIRSAAKPGAVVSPAGNLELDLGLDSMERVELLTRLEQTFGVRVPEDVARRLYTVRELVEAVRPADGGVPRDSTDQSRNRDATTDRGQRQQAWSHLLTIEPVGDPAFAELDKSKLVAAAFCFAILKTGLALVRLLMRIEITGREHIPHAGPFLLSPNHQSYLDSILLVAALPFHTFRKIFFVGASEYFETRLTSFLAHALNIVPVDPDANLVRAMQAGAYGLRRGKVLILFPEGERSIDGTVRTFKKGAAILSLHLDAPIVPVAIDGLYEVWPRKRPFAWGTLAPWRRHRVALRFGAPLSAATPASRAEDPYVAGTARLRDAVQAMWTDLHRSAPSAVGPRL